MAAEAIPLESAQVRAAIMQIMGGESAAGEAVIAIREGIVRKKLLVA